MEQILTVLSSYYRLDLHYGEVHGESPSRFGPRYTPPYRIIPVWVYLAVSGLELVLSIFPAYILGQWVVTRSFQGSYF